MAIKQVSQSTLILASLKRGHRLTQREAINLFLCYRLASRISDLRGKGWNIKRIMKPNGNGGRHAQYYMGRPHRLVK